MGQNSVGGSAKPGIRKDGRIVSCMFKDKTEAKQELEKERGREPSRSAKSIRAAGKIFLFFYFSRSPAVKMSVLSVFLGFFFKRIKWRRGGVYGENTW